MVQDKQGACSPKNFCEGVAVVFPEPGRTADPDRQKNKDRCDRGKIVFRFRMDLNIVKEQKISAEFDQDQGTLPEEIDPFGGQCPDQEPDHTAAQTAGQSADQSPGHIGALQKHFCAYGTEDMAEFTVGQKDERNAEVQDELFPVFPADRIKQEQREKHRGKISIDPDRVPAEEPKGFERDDVGEKKQSTAGVFRECASVFDADHGISDQYRGQQIRE